MKRAFDFDDDVKNEAFFRQWNRCGHCGRNLVNIQDFAHHVVPNQSGDASDPDHDWLRCSQNCVILCSNCHYRVHENGKYKNGAVAGSDYFPYSHGGRKFDKDSSHKNWALKLKSGFWNKE